MSPEALRLHTQIDNFLFAKKHTAGRVLMGVVERNGQTSRVHREHAGK